MRLSPIPKYAYLTVILVALVALGFVARASGDGPNSNPGNNPDALTKTNEDANEMSEPDEPSRRSGLHKVDRSGLLFAPEACTSGSRGTDIVYHFHGVPHVVADALEQAKVVAALQVVNEGPLSDSYHAAWTREGAFQRLHTAAAQRLADYCQEPVRIRRVALSSFSAGFAAVQQLLAEDKVRERVDAVLLVDSLHAAYTHPTTRRISTAGLQPFLEFARSAVRRKKLMAITHSSISTEGYASTTETADYLLGELGLQRTPRQPAGSLTLKGDFWLLGTRGADRAAHARHLHEMGKTVFERLRLHWQNVEPDPGNSQSTESGQ